MVRKSTKSIQNSLNEIQKEISKMFDIELETVTDSAYSQARKKLDFKAFEALSNEVKIAFYKDGKYKKYKGFRLTAFDGSTINLPNNESIKTEFSTTERKNQYEDKNTKIVQGRISCFYDVLNKIVLDSILSDNKIGEVTIAKEHHLKYLTNEDLLICDRGYSSFEMFALIVFFHNSNFLVRLKKNSFKEAKILFDPNSKIDDMTVEIKAPTRELENKLKKQNIPSKMKIRFVRVMLDDGEIEVLATSVLSEELINTNEFKDLYFQRWGIETFYDVIKNRLSLENFTGYTALAIKQDFYATIFISNLESVMTCEIDDNLEEKIINNKYAQQTNKAVSFNTIKNYCFELFYGNFDIDKIFEEMSKLFLTNPVLIKPNRSFNRATKNTSSNAIKRANWMKRRQKNIF
jgi:hypothetical protein